MRGAGRLLVVKWIPRRRHLPSASLRMRGFTMDRKAVNEIRKLFNKNSCRIDKLRGCYVDENKQRVFEMKENFLALPDEEFIKYSDLFKKTMSGRFGRTLFNLSFPMEEEQPGGKQEFLYRLNKSGLMDEAMLDEFYQKIIDTLQLSGKYLILAAHGVYDIPGRTTDNIEMDDASEFVYEFTVCSICPITLTKEGLCCDAEAKTFVARPQDLGVDRPMIGFLFPAFNDRASDIHAALYYSRKADERHEEFVTDFLGTELPLDEDGQRGIFRKVIEDTLGRDCGFEEVKEINEAIGEMLEAAKESPEPVILEKADVRRLLENSGADEDTMKRFDAVYDDTVEDGTTLLAENVTDTSKLEVKTNGLKLSVKAEMAPIVETRVIDGIEYFLIPVSDDVEVNGIRIRSKREEK